MLTPAPTLGHIHSIETGSAVDGPGVRVVLFMAGCLLRCQFCHNPDTWARGVDGGGTPTSVDEAVGQIVPYIPWVKRCGGGVTFSGGEPLLQWDFLRQVSRRLKEEHGVHIAVQTAAFLGDRVSDEDLDLVDLWMVDFKSADQENYRRVTGVDQPNMLRFVRRLADRGRPLWATYVLVPGLTDSEAEIDVLSRLVATLPNAERFELRPFHQLGRTKWQALGVEYPLADTATPSDELIARVASQLRSHSLPVVVA